MAPYTTQDDSYPEKFPLPAPDVKDGAIRPPEYSGVDTSGVDPKKVLLKMDLHLIPMLALLYLLSFLDRGNIGNARIEGLVESLNMTGPQYNWCCTCSDIGPEPQLHLLIGSSDRLLLHILPL